MSEDTRSNTPGAAFRLLPSVEQVLSDPAVEPLGAGLPRDLFCDLVRGVIDAWRGEIKGGALDADGLRERLAGGRLAEHLAAACERERRRGHKDDQGDRQRHDFGDPAQRSIKHGTTDHVGVDQQHQQGNAGGTQRGKQ